MTGSDELQLSVAGGNDLQISLNGPAGPVGPTGPTGLNSITTATASNLTGFIAANGTNVSGATAGATAATPSTVVLRDATGGANFADVGASSVTSTGAITTTGANAAISTSGVNGSISTSGFAANIFTNGQLGFINTSGNNAQIYTSGDNAHISTSGVNAYIQSRSTFKLYDGDYTTTLSHSPTADRAIALPNDAGTLALTNPSSGSQAFSGSQTFSGQIELTGQAATNGTSAMTRSLADTRYGAIGLAGISAITITNNITPQTIRSAVLAVGFYHVRMVYLLAGTANTGTRHGYDFSGTATVRFFRSRAPSPTYIQVTSNPFNIGLTEASTSAVIEGIINVTVAGTFSMQAAQNTSHANSLSVGASNHMIITPCPNGSIS